MESSQQEEIARRAREIWEAEGRPEGRAAQHWAEAERLSQAEGAGATAATPTPPPAAHGNPAYPALAERQKILKANVGQPVDRPKLPASKLRASATGTPAPDEG